jgi:3-methyladenine DNA glycosylase AlkC
MKNHVDRALAELLARRFAEVHPAFDVDRFTATLTHALPELELKERINLVADELRRELPDDYPTALELVVAVAEADGIEGFTAWPLCSFVERHGLGDPAASLAAMERLTRRFSCEFALRPFLAAHPEPTLAALRRWTASPDEAVRRLASEGTRPHLPWGPKVQSLVDDPELGIGILTALRHDSSEVVRRSVANHLNDIARNHPARVVGLCAAWAREPGTDPAMIRHALRSLVKKGDAGALAVLGFTTAAEVRVAAFTVEPREIRLGDDITLAATLTSTAAVAQRLVVDFVVHHIAGSGTATPKVFKWKNVDLNPGDTVELVKRRRIATASTRRYHAGVHRVELQVAGRVVAESAFDLLDGSP